MQESLPPTSSQKQIQRISSTYRHAGKINHLSFSVNLAGLDSQKELGVREATKLRGNFSGEREKKRTIVQ